MRILSIIGVAGLMFAFASQAIADNSNIECSFKVSKPTLQISNVGKMHVGQVSAIPNMTLLQSPEPSSRGPSQRDKVYRSSNDRLPVKLAYKTPTDENRQEKNADSPQGVFGSVRLAFGNIKTKKDWDRIRNSDIPDLAKCPGKRCSITLNKIKGLKDTIRNKPFFEKLKRVNATINHVITYREDRKVYRKADYWALPSETARYGMGDCEDFATLKMNLLKSAGVPETSMSLVVLRDTRRNVHHAVLAIATNKGNFILDNVNDKVMSDDEISDYKPLYSFSEDRTWLHGVKRNAKTPDSIPPLSRNDLKLEKTSALNLEVVQPGAQ